MLGLAGNVSFWLVRFDIFSLIRCYASFKFWSRYMHQRKGTTAVRKQTSSPHSLHRCLASPARSNRWAACGLRWHAACCEYWQKIAYTSHGCGCSWSIPCTPVHHAGVHVSTGVYIEVFERAKIEASWRHLISFVCIHACVHTKIQRCINMIPEIVHAGMWTVFHSFAFPNTRITSDYMPTHIHSCKEAWIWR